VPLGKVAFAIKRSIMVVRRARGYYKKNST
jgi:hypothetical protein